MKTSTKLISAITAVLVVALIGGSVVSGFKYPSVPKTYSKGAFKAFDNWNMMVSEYRPSAFLSDEAQMQLEAKMAALPFPSEADPIEVLGENYQSFSENDLPSDVSFTGEIIFGEHFYIRAIPFLEPRVVRLFYFNGRLVRAYYFRSDLYS